MKNPQLENGYIRIATEIWEALAKYRLPGEQMQCLFVIIRKTYGWGKKEDGIALSQFEAATGIKKPNIHRALKALKDKNIIVIKKDYHRFITYGFNKNYQKWKQLSKRIRVIKTDNGKLSKQITRGLSKKINTIDTITKDTITKDTKYSRKSKKPTFDNQSTPFQLSKYLFDLIEKRNPNFKKPDLQSWAYEIDKMIRIDKRDPQNIGAVINWCQQNEFWQNNVLSTTKLRKQFDQLFLKMGSQQKTYHDRLKEIGDKWLQKKMGRNIQVS